MDTLSLSLISDMTSRQMASCIQGAGFAVIVHAEPVFEAAHVPFTLLLCCDCRCVTSVQQHWWAWRQGLCLIRPVLNSWQTTLQRYLGARAAQSSSQIWCLRLSRVLVTALQQLHLTASCTSESALRALSGAKMALKLHFLTVSIVMKSSFFFIMLQTSLLQEGLHLSNK